ncbi:Putative polyprenol reductase [Verticillium dahliae VDG2]|nr:Putative polyprenol reductase [Verticillium dahliae VDG2]
MVVPDEKVPSVDPPTSSDTRTKAAPLTDAQKEHFRAHGWLRLTECFTQEQADWVNKDLWSRLGMDPDDKSSWRARTHMPAHRSFDAHVFAPKAWSAITELCGGEDRVVPESRQWRDSLIVNLGSPEFEDKHVRPQDLDNWHVDGDFFVHYLDSPEQGLLVIPLYSDIAPGGGGTVICPDAIPKVARHLHDHPEGVSPHMVPRGAAGFSQETGLGFFADRFDRRDAAYSLVEQVTLRALGAEALPGWRIAAPRELRVPNRLKVQQRMKEEALRRLGAGAERPGPEVAVPAA